MMFNLAILFIELLFISTVVSLPVGGGNKGVAKPIHELNHGGYLTPFTSAAGKQDSLKATGKSIEKHQTRAARYERIAEIPGLKSYGTRKAASHHADAEVHSHMLGRAKLTEVAAAA